jgi:hypothetical protein
MPGINWSGNVKHWHLSDGEWDSLCGHAIKGEYGATSDLDAVTCLVCLRSRVRTLEFLMARASSTTQEPEVPRG